MSIDSNHAQYEGTARRDLLVQSRFRNLILWEAMAGRNSAEVCREIKINQAVFGKLLNLRISPFKKYCTTEERTYTRAARAIAKHFKILPEDMFPESLYSLELPDKVERSYASVELLPLLAAARMPTLLSSPEEETEKIELKSVLEELLHTVTPREERIIRMRFGLEDGEEHTLNDVASVFNLTTERIRQIETRALRKLRHPSRSEKLTHHYYGAEEFCPFCKERLMDGQCKNILCPSRMAKQLAEEAKKKHEAEIQKLKLAHQHGEAA
jgi:RNA polymerase sigma factor (sigma-70 family)